MFNDVISRANFPDMEEGILRFWKENDIFLKSSQRGNKGRFMLFEGPPTANGSPGMHHVLARVFKDVICRYKSMKGYQPYRKGEYSPLKEKGHGTIEEPIGRQASTVAAGSG